MRRGKKQAVIYWDANMFIRLLAGRTRDPLIYDAIYERAMQVRDNEIVLVTSSFTRTEISITHMRPAELAIFDGIMRRRNVIDQPYDGSIATLADAIQTQLKASGRQLGTPDLIHCATAVFYEVDELHTTNANLKACDGNPTLRGVRILTPSVTQSRLF
jgi:predicted nucleic acid-binding protein